MNIIERGIDASWGWPDLQTAWNAGYRFLAGYLSRDPSKNWTAARLAEARRIGFDCLFNWETTIDAFRGGFSAGVQDALDANRECDALGVPGNVWVWYSVDTGASAGQVRAYFQGIVSVGRRLAAGYGGSEILTLVNEGLLKGWWESNAGSWSGHSSSNFPTDAGANLRQIIGHTVGNVGGSTDENWLYSTNGLWLASNHPAPPTAPAPAPTKKRTPKMFVANGSTKQYMVWDNGTKTWFGKGTDVKAALDALGQAGPVSLSDEFLDQLPGGK